MCSHFGTSCSDTSVGKTQPCTACSKGEQSNPTKPGFCSLCPAGTVAPNAGTAKCSVCPQNTTALASGSTACTPWCVDCAALQLTPREYCRSVFYGWINSGSMVGPQKCCSPDVAAPGSWAADPAQPCGSWYVAVKNSSWSRTRTALLDSILFNSKVYGPARLNSIPLHTFHIPPPPLQQNRLLPTTE